MGDHPEGHVHLFHDGSEFPIAKSSQWYDVERGQNEPFPFPINITFTSEADVQRELALRKVFRTHCPGLPSIGGPTTRPRGGSSTTSGRRRGPTGRTARRAGSAMMRILDGGLTRHGPAGLLHRP